MKGIYIYSTNDKDYMSNGESKKVLSQVDAFKKKGIDIRLLDVVLEKNIYKVLYRLPFLGVYPKSFRKRCEKETADARFVYIRKNIFDRTYYALLRTIKKANPNIKIIVEIPTYPYFKEWNRLIDKPLILKENIIIPRVVRNHLVDYYITLSDDIYIYGLPTIRIENCISVDDYRPKKYKQDHARDVHLIGVALLTSAHGYDRVIKGMYEYYKKRTHNTHRVVFHIVGEGSELNNLKRLVNQYKLEEHVIFEGKQKGERLDCLYDISDVGIGALGLFRLGLFKVHSLKHREYCAKGIPFIKGCDDEIFDNYKYCLSFSNDDTPIDISKIVEWSKTIDYKKATETMRRFAAHNLEWGKYINIMMEKIEEE